jgi:hypothetical protein
MTVWAYDITADGVSLLDYCQQVVIATEYGMSEAQASEFRQPGQHGTIYMPGQLYGPGDVRIHCHLRFTDSDGAITHEDGEAGHIYENLAVLKEVFGKVDAQIVLQRETPHQGTNTLLLKPGGQPSSGGNRFEVIFPMIADKPFWRGDLVETTLTGTFDPGGNAPVDDAVLTFGGAGSVENGRNGDKVAVSAACVVDCGKRTVTAGGSPAPGLITPANDRWLHLEPGNNPITGSCSISYYPKWR